MHGVLARVRGPFTPSQWMELEHQALIYKYIVANAPIPSNLLFSIRKSLSPSGFSAFSAGSFRNSTLAWGSFHLGFSGNTDPEPGRCRRTDGKKWRCSRDAVADHKYCERHMNRGRHRSRKPVEGQTGHAAKAMPITAPLPSASTISGGGSSNSLTIEQQQIKSLQPSFTDSFPPQPNKMLASKETVNGRAGNSQNFSMLTLDPKPVDTMFPIPVQHNLFEKTSSRSDFELASSDSLLNSSRSIFLENRNFLSSLELHDEEAQPNSIQHFIDDWPRNQSEVEEMQSDRTRLSISIPMASSDFSSSTSSPTQEKLTLSPLKSSHEFNPIEGGVVDEVRQQQPSWIPISWETSIAGPLGEVLSSTNNSTTNNSKDSSPLNLMTNGWDLSPGLGSSPTGVLQKTVFGSVSSSTASSPRTEKHKTHDSISSLCDDLLGSTLVNSSSIYHKLLTE